ncbi:MAG: Gfo/Idh/MocA family oxidoreductase [Armatimonadetes bacterium]|nr:Gfo/Idh/MocA family oxidoreductase [Armatimonadota bacterium]
MANIGLMGCGVVADYGHLPAMARTDGLECVALYDPDAVRLSITQSKHRIERGYTDAAEFMASGLDAVAITSPATAHHDNVLLAAAHRLPVLCEKPLALDQAEAEAMISAMQAAGAPLWVGFDYRFSPVSQQIRALIAEGAIGRVRDLRLVYLWDLHGREVRGQDGVRNQRREGRMLEGGPMADCGVHQIDLARWWTGSEVVDARAEGVWVEGYAAPDHMYLHLDHADGTHTLVEISYSYGASCPEACHTFVYEIIGTDGLIRYDRERREFWLRNSQGSRELTFAGEKNFDGMYAEFSRVLAQGGETTLPTALDGLTATRLAMESTLALMRRRTGG